MAGYRVEPSADYLGPRLGTSNVAIRYLAVGLLTVAVAAVHLKHRPQTMCLFRSVTGIPCPFCGGTTAASDLGHGNLGSALRASPLAIGLLTFVPLSGRLRAPAWWTIRRRRWLAIGVALALAEIWQLARFGLIHL